MRNLLFVMFVLSLGFVTSDAYSQSIDQDCECDIVINSSSDRIPGNGNSAGPTRNKTICFVGEFDYELNWANLGSNVTLCVGEEVEFTSRGLNFEGSKKIINYGEFEYGQSIELDPASEVWNYGKMLSKFNFQGGSLQNLSTAHLIIEGYSDFNSGSLFSDFTSFLEVDQSNWIGLGKNFNLESQGEAIFKGQVENRGNLTLAGKSEFENRLSNLGYANLSGELIFENGYVSNSRQAVTETNGFLEIDGDVNLWEGYLEANAGFEFKGNTRINGGARLRFMGEAKFDQLDHQGEIITNYSCNTFIADKVSGYGGQLTALGSSSIFIENFDALPNSWQLTGDISREACENEAKVVVWLGSKSSDAEDRANWSRDLESNSNILIPKTRNNPEVSEKLSGYDILIKEGAALTNFSLLELRGNLQAEGELKSAEGEIKLIGSKKQALELNSKAEIKAITIDNSKDVELKKGSIDILRRVEILNGNLISTHPGDRSEDNLITFKSDSLHTAILTQVNNGKLIGNVRIERFLSKSNRAFRYLSSSVNSSGSIRDNWQEGVNNTVNNYNSNQNPNPGYGTHISGSRQGAKGFDATGTGNPSLFTWNASSTEWEAISNTDENKLIAGQSYSLMVRGDRSTNIYSSNSAYTGSTVLRTIGELISGDVDMSDQLSTFPNGFTLVGNPYQAQVDLKTTLRESSSQLKNNFFYAWSPALQTRGGYITVDLDSEPVEIIPAGREFASQRQKDFKYLQPNQSVFIQTAPSASERNQPSLVFKEEYKSNETVSKEVFRTPEQEGKIDLTLIRSKDDQVVDGVRLKFNDTYDNDVNEQDATKFWNNEEAFSILAKDANYLAIEKRKYPEVDEKLEFWIGNYTSQNYSMLVNVNNIKGFKIIFKDTYTEEEIELNAGETKIDFEVDGATAKSSASDRFEITFEPVTLSTSDNELDNKTQLYPNPSYNGTVYLKLDNSLGTDVNAEVYSMIGQKMQVPSERTSNSELKLNTTTLSTGIYLVKISQDSRSITKKLVIR